MGIEKRSSRNPRTVLHWYDFLLPVLLHRTESKRDPRMVLIWLSCHSKSTLRFLPVGFRPRTARDRCTPCSSAKPKEAGFTAELASSSPQ
jgi:hypothetical protein